jgi:hypothetical protein
MTKYPEGYPTDAFALTIYDTMVESLDAATRAEMEAKNKEVLDKLNALEALRKRLAMTEDEEDTTRVRLEVAAKVVLMAIQDAETLAEEIGMGDDARTVIQVADLILRTHDEQRRERLKYIEQRQTDK